MGDRVAPAAAAAGRRRGAGEQDGAHRLGGDAAREGIPAQGYGGLVAHGTGAGACERAMTRDGTVGRSDATERSLPFHWDIDPARMMRPRFADSIRASSPSGLREQAGHMTASDFCAARYIFSCQAGGGGHPHMKRREFITLLGGAAAWPVAAGAQQVAMPVVGVLYAQLPDAVTDRVRGFRQGLKDTGYVEGDNVAIVYRSAENQDDRLPALAAELVN